MSLMFFGGKKDNWKAAKTKSKVFGAVLDLSSKEIPQILESCVVFLDSTGLEIEGIFRKSGSVVVLNQYKERFDNGEAIDFSDTDDPHIVAGLLKMFIRDYPEPLLTFELYDCFLAAVAIPDKNTKIPKVKQVLLMLPEANLRIVRYLVSFLCRVTAKSATNFMTPQNLAIVFAPNLLRPPYEGQQGLGIMMEDTPYANELLQLFINNYDALFLETIKPVGATQKAQPTPPASITTPTRPPVVNPGSSLVSPRLSVNPLPTPPTSPPPSDTTTAVSPPEPAPTQQTQEPELYPNDLNPFTSPGPPPPKPASRFTYGLPPDLKSALPVIPETKVIPPVPPRSNASKSEFFSPPNPPPKPSRVSLPPPPNDTEPSNPFEEDEKDEKDEKDVSPVPVPKIGISPVLRPRLGDKPAENTNPFASPTAPPKPPPRNLPLSKSASSIHMEPNPSVSPTAPSKPTTNGTPQPPVKPPRLSAALQPGDTNPFSPPPRPPRSDLSNSTGVDGSLGPSKPLRSPSLNSVGSPTHASTEGNPFLTPAPPPKPTRSNHKYNNSLPNASQLVEAANKRPQTAPTLYPPLQTPDSLPVPSSQLYPVLTESK